MGAGEVLDLELCPLQPKGGVMRGDIRGVDEYITRGVAACDHRSLFCMKRMTRTRVVQSQFKDRFHEREGVGRGNEAMLAQQSSKLINRQRLPSQNSIKAA